jgi:hypothetical protein
MFGERRQFGRRKTRVHATIARPGRPVIACVMHDVSEIGALLEVERPEWMPVRFRLIVEALGIDTECEVVRRTDVAVGVRFASRLATNPAHGTHDSPARDRGHGVFGQRGEAPALSRAGFGATAAR